MKLTIVPSDGVVIYNGIAINNMDMTGLPSDLHVVQYNDLFDIATEEWSGDEFQTTFDNISKYQFMIDRWQVAYDIANPTLSPEELLEQAKIAQENFIREIYHNEDREATILAGGNTYEANKEYIQSVYIERMLADTNGETEIILFDVDLNHHTVSLTAVDNVIQDIRAVNKAQLLNAKTKIKQIRNATTIEEVELIVW